MSSKIIHVDMDAFYASAEVLQRPELAGRPVVVAGAADRRGVVAAASYEARRFGVYSAMATAVALRRCPELIVIPPRHALYAELSAKMHEIFYRFTPQIEPLALDEAFLDVTASERLFGGAVAIGRQIKALIKEEIGLIASVGVAPNKYLAKLASDMNKPDGFLVVRPESVDAFLEPLPIGRLWGVGKVTARQFQQLGIETLGQLRHYSPQRLEQQIGRSAAQLLLLAQGIDERPVVCDSEAKSISHETTFTEDISDERQILAWLSELTEQVGYRLRGKELKGRTVQLKLRYSDFRTVTRSRTLPEPTDRHAEIWDTLKQLFRDGVEHPIPALRLVGVGVSGFTEQPQQLSLALDGGQGEQQSEIDRLVDSITDRFGKGVVQRGHRPR